MQLINLSDKEWTLDRVELLLRTVVSGTSLGVTPLSKYIVVVKDDLRRDNSFKLAVFVSNGVHEPEAASFTPEQFIEEAKRLLALEMLTDGK